MQPRAEALVMYGAPSEQPPLEWAWVDAQLRDAGTYWFVRPGDGPPHPRPVWGVWSEGHLSLSIGSPVLARDLATGEPVTVHLDSGVDVVIVEGRVQGTSGDVDVVARYDAKYDWSYHVAEYGPLTVIDAVRVLAWRSAGWAGRDGFQQTGRWRY